LIKSASFIDLAVVDNNFKEIRFNLNYIFRSLDLNCKYIVKIDIKECEEMISLTKLYDSASWIEREV